MDRYVVREPRMGADYRLNQALSFRATSPRSNAGIIPQDNIYYGGYANECLMVGHEPNNTTVYPINTGYMGVQQCMNTGNYANFNPGQGQMLSGIDPRYLTAYSDNAAPFIVTGHQVQDDSSRIPLNLGSDYEQRSFVTPDRNKISTISTASTSSKDILKPYVDVQSKNITRNLQNNDTKKNLSRQGNQKPFAPTHVSSNKNVAETIFKEELQIPTVTRSDKLKALHKSGPRAFSGPVEKILKWHKALQEIGVLVIYELVAKCVSIRQGESCAKNLVVRDDNGPAMQVVYYEIDFLLPELKPPCTVRIVGRMMAGTSRLQAFNVRLATGDDVTTMARRAAVAAHHVAKLCKEYGVNT